MPNSLRVRIHNYPSIKFDSFRHFFNTEDEEIIRVEKITEEDKAVNWQPKSR